MVAYTYPSFIKIGQETKKLESKMLKIWQISNFPIDLVLQFLADRADFWICCTLFPYKILHETDF